MTLSTTLEFGMPLWSWESIFAGVLGYHITLEAREDFCVQIDPVYRTLISMYIANHSFGGEVDQTFERFSQWL